MNRSGQQACSRGNRHAHEVFSVGTTRVSWLRVGADVKARQTRSATQKKKKTDERAGLHKMQPQLRIHGIGRKWNPQTNASKLGAMPNVITSARESSSSAEVTRGIGHAQRCGHRSRQRELQKEWRLLPSPDACAPGRCHPGPRLVWVTEK